MHGKKRKIFWAHFFLPPVLFSSDTQCIFSQFKYFSHQSKVLHNGKRKWELQRKIFLEIFKAAILWKYSRMSEFCKRKENQHIAFNQTNHSYFILKLHFTYLPNYFTEHCISDTFHKEKWCQASSHLGDTSQHFQNILQ